ncbi:hypothetical protein [uncultured Mediterranean phage uvMED]|nr:hypothetical protein [uncultured Mediterranean phage uvMED]BAR19030.1 hypothetical protein [uncultured Mediterranean phage uvMED]
MSKEKTLESAIQEFKNGIKQSDYVKLGAKGEYLTVPYRIKFFREYFGSRGQILTFSSEMANGSSKFRASVFLDGKELSVGESKQMLNRDKEFEKAQTVSVGRALSILGFMGNEIATAEEIEDFIKDKEQPKQIKKEVKKTIPKATQDTKVVANEWIAKLKEQAKHSVSVNKFEQGIQSLSNEYIDELKQIALDPLEELRVEQEYNKLKTQIQGRK